VPTLPFDVEYMGSPDNIKKLLLLLFLLIYMDKS